MGTNARWLNLQPFLQVQSRGHTGAEAARFVMQRAGIHDVDITVTPGRLTDHYDPTNRRLALSHDNYHGTSLAALGVAAHEAGHAIQHKVGYSMLNLRMALVPMTGFASKTLPMLLIAASAPVMRPRDWTWRKRL